jgi:protein O-GlcNAc transferase
VTQWSVLGGAMIEVDALLREGVTHHRAGETAAAESIYRLVLAHDDGNHDALNLLGVLLFERGHHQEALLLLQQAASSPVASVGAMMNYGKALTVSGRLHEAVTWLQLAVSAAPDFAEAHHNLGLACAQRGQPDEAEACYRRALELLPEFREAALDLGRLLAMRGNMEEAGGCYARLAEGRGDHAALFLDATLMPPLLASAAEVESWRERFRHGLEQLEPLALRIANPVTEVGVTNFFLSYHGKPNRDMFTKSARIMARACPSLQWEAPHCARWRGPRDRIRVGFISRHLFAHSIGKTSLGLIERLARERFEVHALLVPPLVEDSWSAAIRTRADASLVLPESLEQARLAIASLELDVLFYQDIGLEPFTYYLAFSRLAPVQCVSFGHPDTTGLSNIDYFVSNDWYEPDGAQSHYSEQLFQLRGLPTLAYYHRPRLPEAAPTRLAFGLPQEAHIYTCPQTLFKFHPEFDAILAGILERDAKGVVVLIRPQVSSWLQLLLRRLHARGPQLLDRVLVVPMQEREVFLSLLAVSDVMLDTLHFNGMNTSLEAFSVGLPVVTLPGPLQRGRHTQTMYRCMEITEAVVHSEEDYVDVAVALGGSAARRAELRERIKARNDVLFENDNVVREFERFFEHAVGQRGRA